MFGRKKRIDWNKPQKRELWVNKYLEDETRNYLREHFYSVVVRCWNCATYSNFCIPKGDTLEQTSCPRCKNNSLIPQSDADLQRTGVKRPGLTFPYLTDESNQVIKDRVEKALQEWESTSGLVIRGHVVGES